MEPNPAATEPAALEQAVCLAGGAQLLLRSPGGESLTLDAGTLRSACRCASCTRARMDGVFPEAFPGIEIRRIAPYGSYALNLTFSDGHDRGLFPFVYLRSLALQPSLPEAAQQ